jgi:hypothetical protein
MSIPSPSKALAIRLLDERKEEIARDIVQQVAQVAPSFATIDVESRVHGIRAMVETFVQLLRGKPGEQLFEQVKAIAAVRTAAGVEPEDILASTYCYLPVVRWHLVDHSPTPLDGLYAYDEVESVLLPIVIKVSKVLTKMQTSDYRPAPDEFDDLSPFSGFEEDEDTVSEPRRIRTISRIG